MFQVGSKVVVRSGGKWEIGKIGIVSSMGSEGYVIVKFEEKFGSSTLENGYAHVYKESELEGV